MQEREIQHIKQQFGILGNAQALNRAIVIATQVAPTAMTVLITGESGSGKESFSKLIHSLSTHKHGQFIAVNCGAIPEGTIDSELFGHKKGAFTGAVEERKGYFEAAHGGTIFLDEIAELPLSTQARLLRVLEYGEFIKVGASNVQKTKIRVIAATHVDLLDAVYQRKFREDLYYRLTTLPLRIPPLRERGEDILLLFRKFATDFAEKYYVRPLQLTEEAQKVLRTYHFPGNIRQLKNLVEQISVLERVREIQEKVLLRYLPPKRSNIPILSQQAASTEAMHERDLLYKIFFDLKRDVNELKRLVVDIVNTDTVEKPLRERRDLLLKHNDTPASNAVPVLPSKHVEEKITTYADVSPITEEEDLSIESKERFLIKKALKKHQNRRKEAAQSLGISERTLYRKIKLLHL